ncbi:hypothetical protein K2173_020346 [Erythroxylum novogranatense]|uniref:Uncharacterized protein n=1 Tax=Erythroxylum novogranatense TaxID=1862640 RepID=A0AAV8U7M9_9ROSI|nr:hypothetical protein K2173_020346 [Erythroxylum novogranatense]
MPDNKAEERFSKLCEQGIFLSRAVGNQATLNFSWPFGQPIASSENFNLKSYISPELDCVAIQRGESSLPYYQEYTQLIPGIEYSRGPAIYSPLNVLLAERQNYQSEWSQPGVFGETNCYDQQVLTSRGFSGFQRQQEYECADSPTVTANSERSEITEASSDLHFYKGQQQLLRDQQQAAQVAHPMQQSGYNDMHILQQQMMFKQLQELQKQQQLEHLGDSLNQFSSAGKHTGGVHFSPLINGTPVHDSSQVLRNLMQQGAPPLAPGMANKLMFSQEQLLALQSMGLASQQLDLYGMPITSMRDNMGQQAHVVGISHNSVSLASGQIPKSMIHSSNFANSYTGDTSAIPLDLVGLPQGTLTAKEGFQEKGNLGQLSIQGLNGGVFPGNPQEGNSQQPNISRKEFDARQEQNSWPAIQQTEKQLGSSQGLVPLDPMEAKILYNMDESIWNAFGSRPDMSAGGYGNALEHADSLNAFPSVQSGSWSALMQSAVAEASSSDTGMQEEWSGLTFQNTEHSTDNQISSFVDSEKHQTGWADNLQGSSSFNSKPFPFITDSSQSSSFTGFPQPNIHFLTEKREDMLHGGPNESIVDYNHRHEPSVVEAQKVQLLMSADNAWAGQLFEHTRSDGQLQRISSNDLSKDVNGHEILGKSQQVIDGARNCYGRISETNVKQQSSIQSENSSDYYMSKRLGFYEQRHLGPSKIFDNVSNSSMTVDKGSLPEFQESSRASEEITAGRHQNSHIFDGSGLPDGSNVIAQTGEHMLELLQKVDQSKDDGFMRPFGSTVPNALPKLPGEDSCDTAIAQLCSQPSTSQGFGLKLGPSSQRLPNSSHAETVGKNWRWLGSPSSFQPLPSLYESSQRMPTVERSSDSVKTGFSSHLNMQGNDLRSLESGSPSTRNLLQMHPITDAPVKSESWQVNLPNSIAKYAPFTQSSTQDAHGQIPSKPVEENFPVLEASPVPQRSAVLDISRQDENFTKPHNVWINVPTQRQQSGAVPVKFHSSLSSYVDLSNNFLTSTSPVHGVSNDQKSVRSGHKPLEFSGSYNSQSFGFGAGKEILQRQTTPDIFDTSQSSGVSQGLDHVSDATVHASASLVSHSQQQDLDKARNSVAEVQHATEHQFHKYGSSFRKNLDNGLNEALQSNQASSVGDKMLSFLGEARDRHTVKASSQPTLLSRTVQDMLTFSHNDSQTQSSGSGPQSNNTSYSQVNLQMVQSWFKQNGSLQNGQMARMFDSGLSRIGKSSQDLDIQTSMEQLSSAGDAGQGGMVWPNGSTTVATSQQVRVPYTSGTPNQLAIIRPKKRKAATIEPLPWHKEVTQDSKRVRSISISEENWAQATNRLIEKVENEVIEEVQPVVRSKRRLVLTRQLMQQLFCPAPASFLSADSASNYDLISYLISRLSMGDVCSLTYCQRNDCLETLDYSNMNSEEQKVPERSDQQVLDVLDNFTDKAKKLEKDFQRLEKTSVVEVRLELQELEKFSVINRFAKFHVRGHMDASGILRPTPQKYFAALPSPKNLPDGVQCLSL